MAVYYNKKRVNIFHFHCAHTNKRFFFFLIIVFSLICAQRAMNVNVHLFDVEFPFSCRFLFFFNNVFIVFGLRHFQGNLFINMLFLHTHSHRKPRFILTSTSSAFPFMCLNQLTFVGSNFSHFSSRLIQWRNPDAQENRKITTIFTWNKTIENKWENQIKLFIMK